ncbi:MAG TPA: PPK2 family polyphosphate kinase [Ktedonobacterales bacterium]|jgi:PPK2 family polyphosphate:nucleotide phosphotransferase
MPLSIIDTPGTVKLSRYDPNETGGLNKKEVESRLLPQLAERRERLQEMLYAAQQQSVLIILQGMDTSGKDGTIKHVMSGVNPSGCRVWNFKAPSEEELSHDFLWRVHRAAPPLGMIGIFNRSHYEDVLIARVRHFVPPKVWKKRYQQINDFEEMLSENGVLIFKFFLHISKEEQEERLLAREEDPIKAWKIAVSDWQERVYWDEYIEAYEEALGKCSTSWAPWHIVPANKKWYRNYVVAEALIEGLEPHARGWEKALKERGERSLSELRVYHQQDERKH